MAGIGENLYLWRFFRGLSQEALAKKAGIPRPNLSAIENGKREPSLTTLRMLSLALGVAPGRLLDGIPPVAFGGMDMSRETLEKIVRLSLGKREASFSSQEKNISNALSKIIRNRINARNKIYKNTLRGRQAYILNWLMLKATVNTLVLGSLLSRLDKHMELESH